MRIIVAGGNGFIGKSLTSYLRNSGHEVTCLLRKDFEINQLKEKLEGCDVVINAVGKSIAGIWTRRRKKEIYSSRVETTGKLVKAILDCEKVIPVYINFSAVGIYDNVALHSEGSMSYANNYLAKLIIDWEGACKDLDEEGCRTILLRMGVVLDKNGGILGRLKGLLRVRFCIGITGNDGLAYIHLLDLLRIIVFIINNDSLHGVVNAVAPEIVSIRDFYRQLCTAGRAKICLWFSPWLIKLFLGEGAVILTTGQRVVPARLQQKGFEFRFPDLNMVLNNLLHQ